jgi:hypothetical protein
MKSAKPQVSFTTLSLLPIPKAAMLIPHKTLRRLPSSVSQGLSVQVLLHRTQLGPAVIPCKAMKPEKRLRLHTRRVPAIPLGGGRGDVMAFESSRGPGVSLAAIALGLPSLHRVHGVDVQYVQVRAYESFSIRHNGLPP